MKTILATTLMAILVTGVVAPALQDAYALKKADNSEKLSPKAYGQKTKGKFNTSEATTQKTGFDSEKKEQFRTEKKLAEQKKAQELVQKLYRK